MGNFSINQVRHLYVAKELKDGTVLLTSDAAGTILPKADAAKSMLWFQYMSPAGIVSSDKIDVANVLYAKATASEAMAYALKVKKLTLDSSVSATPVAGQEYIVRLAFRQVIGLSDDNQYVKYGIVNAGANLSASDFYKKLAISVVKAVANETTPLVNVYLATADGNVAVTKASTEASLSGTYTAILFEEAEQAWKLGKMPQGVIPFEVQMLPVKVGNVDAIWGTVEAGATIQSLENGKNIADLEYFCMGARGDEYRGMGYPNNIETEYLVDASKKYDTLDIHYAYVGDNESVQKSEKDITIVCEDDGSHTDINALIGAINTASGLTIATL